MNCNFRAERMLTITPNDLHWLAPDQQGDELCAHGTVTVEDGVHRYVTDNGTWTVSIAALRLLRTITHDHTPSSLVGDHLIPCCGHALNTDSTTGAIVNSGCDNGLNWWVRHESDAVHVQFDADRSWSGTSDAWCSAVVRFADAVEAFYLASLPKEPTEEDDVVAYAAFWKEWRRLRGAR